MRIGNSPQIYDKPRTRSPRGRGKVYAGSESHRCASPQITSASSTPRTARFQTVSFLYFRSVHPGMTRPGTTAPPTGTVRGRTLPSSTLTRNGGVGVGRRTIPPAHTRRQQSRSPGPPAPAACAWTGIGNSRSSSVSRRCPWCWPIRTFSVYLPASPDLKNWTSVSTNLTDQRELSQSRVARYFSNSKVDL